MNNCFFKNKKIIILSAALIILLGAFLIVQYVIPDSATENRGDDSDKVMSDASQTLSETSIGVIELYDSNPDYNGEGRSHHESIIAIESMLSGEESCAFVKSDGKWKLADNSNVQISHSAVSNLTVNLCSLTYSDKLSSDDAILADCGIDENSSFVSFDNDCGINVVYTLGNKIPDTDMYYLHTNFSDDIYMVKESKIQTIFCPFEDYRIDDMHRVDFDNITKIYYQNDDVEFSLEKGKADVNSGIYYEWKMISPYQVFARDSEVKNLLIVPGASLEAQEYASDLGDFENYGLADKNKMIVYEDADGKSQTIYFSDLIDNSYYFSIDDSPNIYKLSAAAAPFADISIIDVADRVLYLANRTNISKVSIKGDGYDYEIVFNSDSSMEINGKKLSDESVTSEVFRTLCGIYADDMKSDAGDEKLLEIVFEKTDASKVTLEFFADGERYYSVSKDGVPMYSILRSKIEKLAQTIDDAISAK